MINRLMHASSWAITPLTPLQKLLVLLAALAFAVGLSLLRMATGAEFVFASTVIFPVIFVAWFVGKREGFIYAALAAIIWLSADIQSGREFSANWIPLANSITRFGVYSLVAYMTSSLHEALRREHEAARHDPLTGLLNRRSFFETGSSESTRAKRYGHPLGIVFLDLDDFKALNDSRGHEAGDQALKIVSQTLVKTLRSSDVVARLGGDEFSVLLPETNFQAAYDTGHKIAQAINTSLIYFSPVSVSVGIAWFERVSDDFPDMVRAADSLMYEIKKAGKHGVRCKQFELPQL